MKFESSLSCLQERYLQFLESIQTPAAYLLINSSPLFSQLQNRLFCVKLFYENIKYLLSIAFRLILLNLMI